MTYSFITEWMQKEDAEKFDRDLVEDPKVAGRRAAREAQQALMNVFSMAGAMG